MTPIAVILFGIKLFDIDVKKKLKTRLMYFALGMPTLKNEVGHSKRKKSKQDHNEIARNKILKRGLS